MVGVNADEQWMILFEHRAQFRGDALRQKNGNSRADPQKLHVRNAPQLAEKKFQFIIAEEQRVAAAEQDIADRGSAPDIINLPLELRMKIVARGIADQPGTRAVTT